MPHDTSLVATIAVSLAAAFVGGLIAARMHLPLLVGYLVAGIAVWRSACSSTPPSSGHNPSRCSWFW